MESRSPSRILVVRVGALGDTLMATPVVRALKGKNPRASVDFLCSSGAAPLLELNDNVRHVHSLRWRNLPHWLSVEKRALVGRLRKFEYDVAILLESAVRYRQILEKAKIKTILDFTTTPFDPDLHSVVNNLRAAGFVDWDDRMLEMDLPLSEQDRRGVTGLLQELSGRPVVGLHAGYGPASRKQDQASRLKGWGTSHFRRLSRALFDAGFDLVLTGSAEDSRVNRTVSAGWDPSRFLDLAGKTSVRALAALLSRLDLFVSVDSGPAHMAAAVGCPLIVLWGPAKLRQVRPLGFKAPIEILRHPVPCAPCYDTPAMKTCRMNICMQGISPELVMSRVRQIGRFSDSAGRARI